MTPGQTPAPGWYPEATSSTGQRYWDGQGWTEYLTPQEVSPPALYPQATQGAQQPTIPPSATGPSVPQPVPNRHQAPHGQLLIVPRGYRNALAGWALGVAIVSLVLSFFAVVPIIALILGILGLVRSGRLQQSTGVATGRARSVWAICLSAVSILFFLFVLFPGMFGGNTSTFDKTGVQQTIIQQAHERGVEFATVECPTSPTIREGNEFECVGTATDGSAVVINVRIQDNQGSYTWDTNPFK